MASPPSVGVAMAWTLRSPGWSTAPKRRASLTTSGVSSQVTTAATPPVSRYGSSPPTTASARRVGRELADQRADLLADGGRLGAVALGSQAPADQVGHGRHLALAQAGRGLGRRAQPQTAGHKGRL